MQFEAHMSPHRAFPSCGNVLEHFHVELALVVYHWNAGAVNKADAGTFAETGKVEEHCQRHEATRHNLDETVVREPAGEHMFPLSTYT